MRRLGYRTVDVLVDWLERRVAPPLRRATPRRCSERLTGRRRRPRAVRARCSSGLERDVLPFTSRDEPPALLRVRPRRGTWPGALGDFDRERVQRLRRLVDGVGRAEPGRARGARLVQGVGRLPGRGRRASLVSGGSAANMTALACAREALVGADDATTSSLYVSDQAHSSLARAARMLGFRPDQVRVLPVGDGLPARRRDARGGDRGRRGAPGARPLFVVASGGRDEHRRGRPAAASSPSVCRERGVWLHVDAAYGGFAALTERGRSALAGIELADSVTLDPHKWLYQPYECGCLLVRDGRAAAARVRDHARLPARRRGRATSEVNFADLGLQLTRTTRALKLWLSLRTFGLDAFRAAIDRSLDLADARGDAGSRRARRSSSSRRPRSASSASAAASTTSTTSRADATDARSSPRSSGAASALVSSTRLHGRLRAPPLHPEPHDAAPRTSSACSRSSRPAERRAPRRRATLRARIRDRERGWLGAAAVDPARRCRRCRSSRISQPTGARSSPRASVAARGGVRRDGRRAVEPRPRLLRRPRRDGRRARSTASACATLGAGEFFGEIAALDWGAGFALSAPRDGASRRRRCGCSSSRTGALGELVRQLPAARARDHGRRRTSACRGTS